MKIVLTGGGSGGHFYPIIAVAQELNKISKDNRLMKPELYFMSPDPYNEGILFENNLTFIKVTSGKVRRNGNAKNYLLNFLDLGRIVAGTLGAIWKMFSIYPDVVFGKGGYASFPALFAARILRIPVVLHESDYEPGKVNNWAGKFARRIAISYPEAIAHFPKDKTAYTGNPVRKEIQEIFNVGGHEHLGLDPKIPVILVLGGSQGARFINNVIIDSIHHLVDKYQIIHQVGKNNYEVMKETREVVLLDNPNKDRYKIVDYMKSLDLKAAAGAADLVISRAGSAIFEIALWGKPSIIIPIPKEISHDQRENAYSYARSGACTVIEERNLTQGVFVAEINRILQSPEISTSMAKSALQFARKDSATLIANEIIAIALEHES
ncbi:MAG: UDP-N-acetylglucosamine--N-acetylmuramyl-(pentapeptide) pyrophosphoryl-undecaprenol N-acetylglucosamine transferase [Minisyncoccia bacterium]